jgi:hypothetical protein
MSYEEDIAFGVQQMLDADLQFPQDTHYRKPVKTNADHIRSMTDEELAGFLSPGFSCYGCPARVFCEKEEAGTDCNELVANWLKQPYKEDA